MVLFNNGLLLNFGCSGSLGKVNAGNSKSWNFSPFPCSFLSNNYKVIHSIETASGTESFVIGKNITGCALKYYNRNTDTAATDVIFHVLCIGI